MVVDSFVSRKHDATKFGAIIQYSRSDLYSQLYENSNVKFVRRQTNKVVHDLNKTTILIHEMKSFMI